MFALLVAKPAFCRAKTQIYAGLGGGTGFYGARDFEPPIKSDANKHRLKKARNGDRSRPHNCRWRQVGFTNLSDDKEPAT